MIRTVARKEYRSAVRGRVIWVLASIIWLLIVFATYTGWQRLQITNTQKENAAELFQHEWEEQHANPHSAAHFGTYLFKPASVLSMYDNGLNTYLGNTYRVEAHIQHEVNQSEVQQSDTQFRFGELSLAMVYQLLIPLLILLLTFNTITSEREAGTLRMLFIQGARPSTILWGKILGSYAVILTVILPVVVLLYLPFLTGNYSGNDTLRYGLFTVAYLIYFFIFTVLGVVLSGWVRSSGAALVSGIGIWFLLTIFLPKAFIRFIDAGDTLPSRYELNRNISRGYQLGMDGEGSSSERSKKYLAETLQLYGVDSVTQLPVNFDGLAMQYGEDYNAKVYEHFAAQVEATIQRQQLLLEQFSWLNPFIAMQQVSMGLAGTDYYHHLSFHHQAKSYRDEFIRILNMDMANSGSAYLSYAYTVGPEFFKNMPQFSYDPPAVEESVLWHSRAFLALVIWVIVLTSIIIPLTAKRLK